MMNAEGLLHSFRQENALFKITLGLLAFPLLFPFLYAIGVVVWGLTTNLVLSQIFFSIFHKALLFQIVVELACISYLALLVREKKYSPFVTALHSSLIVLGVVLVITSVLSLDTNTSFFGSPRRGDGVFFLLHFGVYIALLSWLIRTRRTFELLLSFAVGAGLASLLFTGLAVVIEAPTALFDRAAWNNILLGTLGNLNFSGHYFLLLLVFAGYFAFKNRTLKNLIAPTVFMFFIVVTSSNTAILLGGAVYMMLLAMYSRWLMYGAMAVGTGAAWYVVLTSTALFARWVSLGDSFIIRWYVWKDAFITLMTHRVWLGYGWGNSELMWNYALADTPAKFYNLSSHFLADRMHNILLEIFSGAGILGVAVLLCFFVILLRRCVRTMKGERDALALFFPVVFVVQFVYLMFNFDTLMSYVLIGIAIAGCIGLDATEARQRQPSRRTSLILCYGALFVTIPFLYFYNGTAFYASFLKARTDEKINKAGEYVTPKTGEIIQALDHIATIKHPYRSFLRDIANSFYTLSDAVTFSPEERVHVSRSLTAVYETLLKHSPTTANGYHNLALIELKYFNNFEGTKGHLEKAVALAPSNGLMRYHLALTYYKLDDRVTSKRVFTQLSEDGIYDGSVNFYLGLIDFKEGRIKEGKGQIITALTTIHPNDKQWDELTEAFLAGASKKELLAWYQTIIRISEPKSPYLISKTARLAKELGRSDIANLYSKKTP